MSKILISGYYGFANAGDEAMLTAIIKALRSHDPKVALTVISGHPQVTAVQYKVNSLHRFNFWRIFRELGRCDLLLSGGGSLLQDVTSKRSLLYYLAVLGLGLFLKKKVMLYAHGIGPINSRFLQRLTKSICSRADLITVRDQDSLYELRRIGIPDSKVRLTADAVLTLPQESPEAGHRLLENHGVECGKTLIAVSVRKWGEDDRYLLELAKAADALVEREHAHIVLLPLQYPVDLEPCRRLQQFMVHSGQSTVLASAWNTEEFLSLMGNFDLLIGMRLHALVFAAVMELPFVAVSYDPKIDGFVKETAGISAGRVESLQAEGVIRAAQKALDNSGGCQGKLDRLREKAMLNARFAFDLMDTDK